MLAEPLGLLLYDSPDAGRYLRAFAPLVPMLYLDCIVDGMHKGLGQQVYCVRVNTLTNLMDVVCLFFLLPRYGIGGYFATFLLTHAVNFFLSLRRLLQLSDSPLPWPYLLALLGCTGPAVVFTTYFLPVVCRWSNVLLRGGVYLVLLALLLSLTGAPMSIDKAAITK